MSQDDHKKRFAEQMKAQARAYTEEEGRRMSQAAHIVLSATHHALVHLGYPVNDDTAGSLLLGLAVSRLTLAKCPPEEIRALMEAQLEATDEQQQAAERIAHGLAAHHAQRNQKPS